jgi:hypothetical protein
VSGGVGGGGGGGGGGGDDNLEQYAITVPLYLYKNNFKIYPGKKSTCKC